MSVYAQEQTATTGNLTQTADIKPLQESAEAVSPWIILGGISRHTCRDCGFRESNPGLAVQWSPKWLTDYMGSDQWRLSAGGYINSNDRNSLYVGAIWQPMEYGSAGVKMKVGVQAAVITNYKEKAILPTLLPVISLETPHAGMDIFLVPKFPSVSAAVLLSFKVRY